MLRDITVAECDGCSLRIESQVIPAHWILQSQYDILKIFCSNPCIGQTFGTLTPAELVVARAERLRLRNNDVLILRTLATGAATARIGFIVKIAESTAKNNLSQIYKKLHARSRMEAVIIADQLGLIDLRAIGRALLSKDGKVKDWCV